jgi:hypothetical protein
VSEAARWVAMTAVAAAASFFLPNATHFAGLGVAALGTVAALVLVVGRRVEFGREAPRSLLAPRSAATESRQGVA